MCNKCKNDCGRKWIVPLVTLLHVISGWLREVFYDSPRVRHPKKCRLRRDGGRCKSWSTDLRNGVGGKPRGTRGLIEVRRRLSGAPSDGAEDFHEALSTWSKVDNRRREW